MQLRLTPLVEFMLESSCDTMVWQYCVDGSQEILSFMDGPENTQLCIRAEIEGLISCSKVQGTKDAAQVISVQDLLRYPPLSRFTGHELEGLAQILSHL